MIFGLGKEKIDYSDAADYCIGTIWTTAQILEKVWDEAALDKLPNFKENEQKIGMVISAYNRILMHSCSFIARDQADELDRFMLMYRYFGIYDIPGSKINVKGDFNSFKEYVEADDKAENILKRNAEEMDPSVSFLYGLMDFLEVKEPSKDEMIKELKDVKVYLDPDEVGEKGTLLNIMQGIAGLFNQYFQSAKIRVSEQDQDIFHALIDEGSYVDYIR